MGKYKRTSGIYLITNIINNKKYVGHSKSIKKRWANHRNRLRRNKSKHLHLQNAWNKYGENRFSFSIIEELPFEFTKKQFEEVETKWVLHFKSHLPKYGYNSTLPGAVPLEKDNSNRERRKITEYVCIHSSGEVLFLSGIKGVANRIGIPEEKIVDLSSYWKGKGRKSLKGWRVLKKEEYDENFDYINYKRERICKYGHRLTNTEYYRMRKQADPSYHTKRKKREDIIPYEKRHLKRIKILAHNIETGEDVVYPTIKECCKYFSQVKVYKCINNEFGKYKHRGCWFKKL